METQAMLPGYLDVVFNGRNKAYGGYELRAHYPGRARNGALYAMLGAAVVCGGLMLANRSAITGVVHKTAGPTILTPYILDPPPAVQPPPPATLHKVTPPASSGGPAVHTDIFTKPVIVANKDADAQLLKPVETTAQPSATSGQGADVTTGSTDGTGEKMGVGTGPGTGTAPGLEKPLKFADVMPEFAGLNKFLSASMRYPNAARENGIAGRVVIRFVVNEDGSISGAEVIKGIGGGCDEEALRVVRSMPHWKPGRVNGQPVKVYFTLPVVFVLQ